VRVGRRLTPKSGEEHAAAEGKLVPPFEHKKAKTAQWLVCRGGLEVTTMRRQITESMPSP